MVSPFGACGKESMGEGGVNVRTSAMKGSGRPQGTRM